MSRRTIKKIVRFSETEWAKIEKRAAAVSMRPCVFLREIGLHGKIKIFDVENFIGLKVPMHSISDNVNQIAKVANSTGSIYAKDIEDLRSEIKRLKSLFEEQFSELRYSSYE